MLLLSLPVLFLSSENKKWIRGGSHLINRELEFRPTSGIGLKTFDSFHSCSNPCPLVV